jgi:hypothetical protein
VILPLSLALALAAPGARAAGAARAVPPDAVLARACAWLWSRQADDGGWHSDTQGLFRSGQALTPFVLHAVAGAPTGACPPPRDGIARALGFVRRHVSADGLLGVADPDVLEYPNYSTAYALRGLVRWGGPDDKALVDKMCGRLASDQYGPANGFDESSPAFGGWGFGGRRARGQTGHMDLAHTRRVLEALREAGTADPALFERARLFLRLMQRHPAERRPHPRPREYSTHVRTGRRFDGGFFFSPVVLDANKGDVLADADGAYHASYATATCDGVLALLAAGVLPGDERVTAARDWLVARGRLDHPEGIPAGTPQDWGAAVYYYHLAVRAEAYAALGLSAALRPRLAAELAPHQEPDGRFVNERNHLMKEDDPLLATALAVIALR